METYFKFLQWFNSLAAVTAALIAIITKEYLSRKITDDHALAWIISIILAFQIFSILIDFAKNILLNSPKLKKLVIGKKYIEGFWVDRVLDEKSELIGGAIINIYFEFENPKVEGEKFSLEEGKLKKIGIFYSTFASFNGSSLQYAFLFRDQMENYDAPGYARYDFIRPVGKYFNRWEGFFFGSGDKIKTHTNAVRVTVENFNKLDDEKGRAEIVKNYIDKY
jgi:hypothetical protein